MVNLTPSRTGFKYDHILSQEGSKSKVIRLEVFYLKSMSGKSMNGTKGVRVSVRPLEIEKCEGYTMESTTLYSQENVGGWLKFLPRKNDKAVLAMAEKIDAHVPAIIAAYLESPSAGRAAFMQFREGAV